MREKLESIKQEILEKVGRIDTLADLNALRVQTLGKKGALTLVLRDMGRLPEEERPLIGKLANEVRSAIEEALSRREEELSAREMERRFSEEAVDVTLPGIRPPRGKLHPLTQTLNRIIDIFTGMGFSVVEGPEVETAYYNFTALNTPEHHPARDVQDTFYFTDDILLRTQTSPVQIRTMEKQKPPLKIIAPGRVYRSDSVDATHSPIFHQVEGLVVDKGISMGDLKGVLDRFAREFFGPRTKTKFRPHHFPFTEPSAEMDITCYVCGGEGCRVCSGSGWVEILGAGMVHPNVLRYGGIDPEEYSGFAFGMGLDRITNGMFRIDDIRLLFENDIRFLKQF
jgi:phenylalanyl-tRNA synthetase alpha chain